MTKELKMEIYHVALRIREIAETERRVLGGNLCLDGRCGTTSTEIVEELRRRGIQAREVYGDGHVFVRTNNHLLDATATQFDHNLPKVVFIPFPDPIPSDWPYYWRERQ